MARVSDRQEALPFFVSSGNEVKPPFDPLKLAELAAKGIFLGTSSWKYRGWEGLIYQGGYESEAQFQRQSLREYTSYFPCVGADFTYYAWPSSEMMAYLIESTPENFRFCPKVTNRITMARFPQVSGYGKWAGKENSEFLNAKNFTEQFLKPLEKLNGRLGTIIFEFSSLSQEHLPKLKLFFETIPRILPMSVELRSPDLCNEEFYKLLVDLDLSPAFNFWSKMPDIKTQLSLYQCSGGDQQKTPLCARALLKPGRTYDEAVNSFSPYNQIKDIYDEGRQQLTELMQFAQKHNRKLFLLVNNRFEGSAPHSVGAVVERFEKQIKGH